LALEDKSADVNALRETLRTTVFLYPDYLVTTHEKERLDRSNAKDFEDQVFKQVFKKEINRRRVREIASLNVAWRSAREVLLAQVPAEQLISWYRWLIDDDIPRFKTGYYFDRILDKHEQEESRQRFGDTCSKLDAEILRPLAHLQATLYDLWTAASRERCDYRAMKVVCERSLSALVDMIDEQCESQLVSRTKDFETWAGRALPKELRETVDKMEIDSRQLKKTIMNGLSDLRVAAEGQDWRTVASLLFKSKREGFYETLKVLLGREVGRKLLTRLVDVLEGQVSVLMASTPDTAIETMAPIEALIQLLKDSGVTKDDELPREDERELFFRLQSLSAAFYASRLPFAGSRAMFPPRSDEIQRMVVNRMVVNIKEIAEGGLVEIRRFDLPAQQAIERFPYQFYRTEFLLYQAHARWLEALQSEKNWDETFKEAYHDYELLDSGENQRLK
jgi:hypothetical protein